MTTARADILGRVRAAVTDIDTPVGARGEVPMIAEPTPERPEVLTEFADNVADYRAEVERVAAGEVSAAVGRALARVGAASVLTPDGLDDGWLTGLGAVRRVRDSGLTPAELEDVDAVVTSAAVGIATTGTIVLDHSAGQGRRALTLVPDVHVCVVLADQVEHDVPQAVRRLAVEGRSGRPLTWISGPSATSDIELDRVEGVHGPRTLIVLLVDRD